MKVTNEKTENRQAYLTVEMEPDEVEGSMERTYRKLVKKTRVPGFRKGKAPRNIFEKYTAGKPSRGALNEFFPRHAKRHPGAEYRGFRPA
jgi:FKBP-type peptidyl-prolyl cis-trans isomerase (trigger factor)